MFPGIQHHTVLVLQGNLDFDVRSRSADTRARILDTFRVYLHLVYTCQLVARGADQRLKLCRLYVLAEKLQDFTSKNQIIGGIYVFFNEISCQPTPSVNVRRLLPTAATTELYAGTPDRNQARELVMDLYAGSGNVFRRLSEQAKLPNDFICDVAVRLLQRRRYVYLVQ
jgi:hypothetical protein